MPFIVVRFKERKLQRRFWNCVRPYDGCFSKTGEIEIWQINDSKEVNVFQNIPFKDIRIPRWNEGRGQNGVVFCI